MEALDKTGRRQKYALPRLAILAGQLTVLLHTSMQVMLESIGAGVAGALISAGSPPHFYRTEERQAAHRKFVVLRTSREASDQHMGSVERHGRSLDKVGRGAR